MTIPKLAEKGFISYIKKGHIKHYKATDPKNIVRFIDEKKRRFQAILPELLIRQKQVERQEAEVYEGFKGLKVMVYEFIKGANRGDEYLFFSFYTKNPDEVLSIYNFYKDFDEERHRLGIVVKGIAPSSLKRMYTTRAIPEVKFVDYPVPLNISVFREKVIFTPWEDDKVSFMIHSRQLAESFRQYFYSIWGGGKGPSMRK